MWQHHKIDLNFIFFGLAQPSMGFHVSNIGSKGSLQKVHTTYLNPQNVKMSKLT
jgi:hypothetical protein